jgi:hypothetical protein
MTALASPMKTYVEEKCDTGKGDLYEVPVNALYQDHCSWRRANGHAAMASSTFGTSLRAAVPHTIRKKGKRQPDGTQPWVYSGIRLKKSQKTSAGTPKSDNAVLPYPSRTSSDEADDGPVPVKT